MIGMTVWLYMQQSRQQKRRQRLQEGLKVGDRVVTIGGVIGSVEKIQANEIVLKVAENVKIHVLKSAISGNYQATSSAGREG